MRYNQRRNGLPQARVNYSQSEKSSLLREDGGWGRILVTNGGGLTE